MNSPKVIVRTGYKLSLNNPDRSKLYNTKDINYVNGIIDYFSDDKKRVMNMIDYFTGKINKSEDINLIDENGNYFKKENIQKRKQFINKQFYDSNIWQIVLSVDKKLVDQNISWENLEKKIGLNSTINVEKSDYDIARETFDKNIIDSYRTICKNVKGCELDRDLGPYDLMKQNLEDYLKIYDRFTPGNFNINFFNQRKKENVMRVIEMEKQLIKNRITFISKKLEVIKSERGEL